MIRRHSLPYEEDSSTYFERVRSLGNPVYLDSCQPAALFGRFDIISAAPEALIRYHRGELTLQRATSGETLTDNPFDALRNLLDQYPQVAREKEFPFCGGLLGHFAYDLGRSLEAIPEQAADDIAFPEMRAGLYLWAVIVDHRLKQATLVAHPAISDSQWQLALNQLTAASTTAEDQFRLKKAFASNVDEAGYRHALNRIDDYIHAGDCYQVNFAQRFSAPYSGDPWQAYKQLRQHAPTPFAAYMESDDGEILSLSPERFLFTLENRVETKPIKGTRPRGKTPEEDQQQRDDLSKAIKDRAENLMIVDLLRNDLSKVCAFGSVRVPKLFDIESYANVHHLVTTVTGKLDQGQHPVDLLKHCFPGGSITGAPKIRAMEIIDELEPHRRSIYCGSIGYISLCGRMDTSITIRTLLCHDNKIHCWAGGGIVADSDIASEYAETFSKVNNLLGTLETTIQK
ncbi:aminodeoxychorismate synthase component I [Marinobacterium jannaschii]|uniref:aminodeoxychorismate synthase component I n=1 Tax=Marinobacterium jannaschii TaxID=64970 RepID=UPI00047FD448|nr:aminodeoxychorismate synthase component I [Marinobacterium jannaschii]